MEDLRKKFLQKPFVNRIVRLKLFIFILFLHFLVLKINKYCHTKDGCYCNASICCQASANMHNFLVYFQAALGSKHGFSHFAGYLKKEKSLRSLNAVFNNSSLKAFS